MQPKAESSEAQIRVLMVIPGEENGATMVFAKRQAAALASSGIICSPYYLNVGNSPQDLWHEGRHLRTAIREFNPDLVHVNYGTMTGFLTTLVSPVPVLLHLRGSDLLAPQATLRASVGRLLSQLAALGADRIICVAEHLRQSLWWRRDRVDIVPSGVDLEIFCPGDRLEARTELGWDPVRPLVLFNAGRDPRVKRLPLAAGAMELVRQEIPEADWVVMRGEVDPALIPTMMQAADCLLLTSLSEGSPNVVKEAMASNLPVVSTDVGDVRVRLAEVQPSLVVPDTAEALAAALVQILKKKERSNGRSQVLDLGLDRTTRKIADIYQRMAD